MDRGRLAMTGYAYATSSIHLAGLMLRHVTGTLNEFVDDHLAAPLGWGRWGFGRTVHG